MTNIYFESVLMAWSSIVSNKMRSLLTMLGIIIGVAAVIALMSIGYGVQDSIKSDISRLGSNTITVTPGTGRKPGVKQAAGSMQTLTYKDYLAIRNLPNITYSAPLVQGSYLLVNGNKNWNTRVYGCTQDYADLSDLKVQEGRFWTQKEYNARARVAVIGKTVATGLFGEEDPVGKKVRIHGNPFTVIGLLEEKGYSFMDQDDRVLCPFSTVQERMLHITYVNNIVISADNSSDLSQIEFLFAAHIQQQAEDQQAHADTDADIRKIEHREIDEQAVQVIHHHAGADTVDQVANTAAHDQNPSSTLQTRHFAQKQHTGQHSQHHTGNDHQQRALAAEHGKRHTIIEQVIKFQHMRDKGFAANRQQFHGGPKFDQLVNQRQACRSKNG